MGWHLMYFRAMLKSVKATPILIILLLMFQGCSKYQKILKSTDYEKKFEMAKVYYDGGKYQKAFPLLEELMTVYRGTSKGETVYYYFAYCQYALGDFLLASFHFSNFAKTFARSEHAEEAMFMGAKCYFLDSSDPTLDQESTHKAIQEIQLFINKYPKSERVAECNDLMDRLRFKLESKDYNIAKLYFNMEDYKAAITSIRNVLNDYPESRYQEEMSFMIVRSSFLLAENSIEKKKEERYHKTLEECRTFTEKFTDNGYRKDIDNIFAASNKALEKMAKAN
ncbi:MAG: outer membrane protein assembly factor BamD [Granulosicoccus sp.]|jgi:outer membrane protein assembly factor BamD